MNISIIIPTLNEVKYLRSTIEHTLSMAKVPATLEFIIVDAGSSDLTIDSISDLSCRVYSDASFRLQKHQSLNFGIKQATHDVLVFLDADTLLPMHFDVLLTSTLENKEIVVDKPKTIPFQTGEFYNECVLN